MQTTALSLPVGKAAASRAPPESGDLVCEECAKKARIKVFTNRSGNAKAMKKIHMDATHIVSFAGSCEPGTGRWEHLRLQGQPVAAL